MLSLYQEIPMNQTIKDLLFLMQSRLKETGFYKTKTQTQ